MSQLNLPGVAVTTMIEDDPGYLANCTATLNPTICPRDGCGGVNFGRFGIRGIRYIDTPMIGKRVMVNLTRQRFRCDKCDITFFPDNPSFDDEFRLTTRAVKWIEQESIRQTFSAVAHFIGIDEKVVRKVFRRYAQKREATLIPTAGECIGIDELYLLRQYRCIITNLADQTVINLLPERKYPAVTAYLKQLDGADRVKTVCIDMWEPYKNAVYAVMPKANVVVDKFHVTKLANECMDKVRKAYQSTLPLYSRRDLMRGRHILLSRRSNLSDEQLERLNAWKKACPELADAYAYKEAFYGIYDIKDVGKAKLAYATWMNNLPLTVAKCFRPLMTAMSNWEDEIFGYFESPFTNAYTECLNGMVKLANRTGRGYSFDVLRFKLLFGHSQHKLIQPTMGTAFRNGGVPFSIMEHGSDDIW